MLVGWVRGAVEVWFRGRLRLARLAKETIDQLDALKNDKVLKIKVEKHFCGDFWIL